VIWSTPIFAVYGSQCWSDWHLFTEGRRGEGRTNRKKDFCFVSAGPSVLVSLTGRVGVLVFPWQTTQRPPCSLLVFTVVVVMTHSCPLLPPLLVMMLMSVLVDRLKPGDILAWLAWQSPRFFPTRFTIFLSAPLLFCVGSIMAQYLLSKPTKKEVRPHKEENLGFVPIIVHCLPAHWICFDKSERGSSLYFAHLCALAKMKKKIINS
jgi:hypothetical protein